MWAQAYSRAYSDALRGSARGRTSMAASRHHSDLVVAPSMNVLSRHTRYSLVISTVCHLTGAEELKAPCLFWRK